LISRAQSKRLAALKLKKYREKERQILVEGLRLIEEVLESPFCLTQLYVCPPLLQSPRAKNVVKRCRKMAIPVDEIDEAALQRLSNTVHAQGLLGVAQMPAQASLHITEGLHGDYLALQNVMDPGNLGTLIRTASWFGMDGLLVSKGSVEFTNPKVIRASMGSVFHQPIYPEVDLAERLSEFKNQGFTIVSADAHGGDSLYDVAFGSKNVFVFGNEAEGLEPGIRALSRVITIPRIGCCESLNVAVAAGVVLSEFRRRK